MTDTPKTASYAVKNTSPGARFVNSAETGRPVSIEPNATVTVELTEAEAKSAKKRGDLELTKAKGGDAGGQKTQAPARAPNGGQPGDGGSADGREQTGNDGPEDGNDDDETKPVAAYVAHEGLGKWFAYDADGAKVSTDDGEAKPMKKEQAQTWASDNKVEFKGSK